MNQADYMNLIVDGLSAADPTIRTELSEKVPIYWKLANRHCNPNIRYLVTLRSAITLLMASVRMQIDTKISESESKSSSIRASRQDAHSQSQSDSSSANWSDSVGTNRYKDRSDNYSEALSSRDKASSSYSDSLSWYNDTGSGSSQRDAKRTVTGSSSRTSRYGYSAVNDTATLQNVSYREKGYEGTQISVTKGGGSIGAAAGAGGTVHETNYSGNTTGASEGFINDRTYRLDHANGGGTVRGRSSNVVDGYDNTSSSFQANVLSHAESHGAGQGNDNASNTSHSGAYGEGHGFGQNRSRSDSAAKSQGKSQSHSDGESHASAESESWSIMKATKYHQRFLHLKDLYDEVDKKIKFELQKQARNSGFSVSQLSVTVPSWCLSASDPRWRGMPCC